MHRLKFRVKINGTYCRTSFFETDAASWHSCSIWKWVFCFSVGQCSITSRQRNSSAAGSRRCPILSCLTLFCYRICALNYCVNRSIWHFKFPKVVQAHTLGEVGILDTVLLRFYFGTIFPNFIEIGLYLTDKEQISWRSFLRHGVDTLIYSVHIAEVDSNQRLGFFRCERTLGVRRHWHSWTVATMVNGSDIFRSDPE